MRNYKKTINFSAFKLIVCAMCIFMLLSAFFAVNAGAKEIGEQKLIPGGIPFGVRFSTEGVIIISTEDFSAGVVKSPAYEAGLRPKDIIIEANGQTVNSVVKLKEIFNKSGGKGIDITYVRDGNKHTVKVVPVYTASDGEYKIGVNVKDSGAGLGTVTYIVPETMEFAGLGHGICDSESGKLIPMSRGVVTDITVSGIKKGVSGTPGEIKGYFGADKKGTLYKNTHCGVYGMFSQKPQNVGDAIEVGSRNDIKNGDAYIICTLDNNGPKKYNVDIFNIDRNADGSKCFTVKIKDKDLINLTGGIVQGMSGSPIIQNNKLVGAVTHVLINDPTTGYGIFIENMLNQMSAA